jgi:hypothetical protein
MLQRELDFMVKNVYVLYTYQTLTVKMFHYVREYITLTKSLSYSNEICNEEVYRGHSRLL